ncbi:hypothetical protein CLM81_06375 [Streptomyces albidoflavus]|nr:hypothetical protein CLM81_06375 [Streptomyces albidoflavus]
MSRLYQFFFLPPTTVRRHADMQWIQGICRVWVAPSARSNVVLGAGQESTVPRRGVAMQIVSARGGPRSSTGRPGRNRDFV